MENFSFEIFNNLFKRDPEKAIAYRDKYRNPEAVAKDKDEEAKRLAEIEKSNKIAPTIIETPKEDTTQAEITENTSEKTFSRAELEDMLKNAGIKFSHLSKDETLIQKCIENKLL